MHTMVSTCTGQVWAQGTCKGLRLTPLVIDVSMVSDSMAGPHSHIVTCWRCAVARKRQGGKEGQRQVLASEGGRDGVHAAQRQLIRNQTRAPGTHHLAPRSEAPNLIKIRKQGVVVPGYATVDGAGLGAFAGMLPADQCAQRAMCAFKVSRAPARSRRP